MTPAERAVLDAARAWAADYSLSENVSRLLAAVRALPRPLSEQLAELRVGAVVDIDGHCVPVLANMPEHMTLVVHDKYRALHPDGGLSLELYSRVSRIISNPEADRG